MGLSETPIGCCPQVQAKECDGANDHTEASGVVDEVRHVRHGTRNTQYIGDNYGDRERDYHVTFTRLPDSMRL
ncbi:MAG: hypothetical protein ABSD02_22885 [Steroidobacteraceae bacterium]|jgi:hypothetical protein